MANTTQTNSALYANRLGLKRSKLMMPKFKLKLVRKKR